MKIKGEYVLRSVAGMQIAVPASANSDFDGMITLNDTALFLWKQLEKGATREELLSSLTAEYDVDASTAAQDLDALLTKLTNAGLLDQEG